MELERTRRNLDRLERQKEFSIDDTLNVIYDFCEDVKDDAGTPVEKLPCRDENAMYEHLPWLGRLAMRINREKEEDVSVESRKERIRKITQELCEIDSLLQEAAGLNNEAKKMQQDLLEKEEALKAEKSEERRLREESDCIRARIEELEKMNLQEEQAKKEALEKEYDIKKQEQENRKKAAEERLAVFCEEQEQKLAELENIRKELQEEGDKLEFKNLPQLQEQIEDLREHMQSIMDLQDEILKDWNSSWGEEQRSLKAGLSLPEAVAQKKINGLKDQVDQYEEQLRNLAEALSTQEVL